MKTTLKHILIISKYSPAYGPPSCYLKISQFSNVVKLRIITKNQHKLPVYRRICTFFSTFSTKIALFVLRFLNFAASLIEY